MTYSIDKKKVIYADLDPSEGVVLNLETKNYYRLNETGQRIWQDAAAGKSPREIAARLAAEFDVDEKEALTDVEELLSSFVREELVEGEKKPSPSYSTEEARRSKKSQSR